MKKRMLTMLLALILVLAALPVASLAAEPKTEPPELVGNMAIQDGGTYYLSMVVAVADEDEDLTKVTLNGVDVRSTTPTAWPCGWKATRRPLIKFTPRIRRATCWMPRCT